MNVAIVVAAGKGTRLGGNQPKQFLELCGVPIIIHTLRQFERCEEINEIIVVVPAESTAAFSSLTEKFQFGSWCGWSRAARPARNPCGVAWTRLPMPRSLPCTMACGLS